MSEISWQAVNYSTLLIEEWNGEFTVFQPEAGKTHFLNQMSLSIIEALSRSSMSEVDVCSILAKQFDQSLDPDLTVQTINTLHRFNELGLIEKKETNRSA